METGKKKTRGPQSIKARNEEYLGKVFTMLKKMEGVTLTKVKSHFNNSEMRLLSEVIMADKDGKRIISTQLAYRLGVTRSAVSQMVNKLEARGIVKRVPDEVDRKIAYIELTEEAFAYYNEEKTVCCEYIGELITKLGKEKVDELLALSDEFVSAVAEVRK
jgi:DNA-binding MarR family transcriptional regulator